MKNQRLIDFSVGLFILAGIYGFAVMALKVSGLTDWESPPSYYVTANFADIGGLKVRAPVTVAGVRIGEVTEIELQPEQLNAKVTMRLNRNKKIPYEDVSARILTEGLLGSNYISIVPGFDDKGSEHPYLANGDQIGRTQEAIILENLIGQLVFNINK